MQVETFDHMFRSFVFVKPSAEITAKMMIRSTEVKAKIEERIVRVQNLKREYKVTEEIWNDISEQMRADKKRNQHHKMSYSSNARTQSGTVEEVTIGAGIINAIITELDYIAGEREQVKVLERIVRNLEDTVDKDGRTHGHKLTDDELEFLRF